MPHLYGLGEFASSDEPAAHPIIRGEGTNFQSAEAMRFSRLKQVVGAIRMQIEQGHSESNVLTEFDQAFGQAGNITSLIKILKDKKYIVSNRNSG